MKMPEWLEKRNPKLARMFDHIVESCQNRDKGKWDLPAGVENCYEYAMGRVSQEPGFKKALDSAVRARLNKSDATKGKSTKQTVTDADYYAVGLTMLSSIKKDLINIETEVMIQSEELEAMRYVSLVGSPEQSRGIPRVIEAYNALEEVQKHLAIAINVIDQAKKKYRQE